MVTQMTDIESFKFIKAETSSVREESILYHKSIGNNITV